MVFQANAQINWNRDWALQCDFPGNDIANVQVRGEDCGSKCEANPSCTHYSWTSYNGGTCWLKSGNINKNNAIRTNDASSVCGVISSRLKPSGGKAE